MDGQRKDVFSPTTMILRFASSNDSKLGWIYGRRYRVRSLVRQQHVSLSLFLPAEVTVRTLGTVAFPPPPCMKNEHLRQKGGLMRPLSHVIAREKKRKDTYRFPWMSWKHTTKIAATSLQHHLEDHMYHQVDSAATVKEKSVLEVSSLLVCVCVCVLVVN